MIIAITGTPGTGKTTLSKKLAKLGFRYIDGKKIGQSIAESYDEEKKTYIVDEKSFAKKIIEKMHKIKLKKTRADYARLAKLLGKIELSKKMLDKKKPDIVIDSHLSHYLPKKQIDLVIVTRCDIAILKQRLLKRKYPAKKIQENIEAEIFDTCGVEARDAGHTVISYGQ